METMIWIAVPVVLALLAGVIFKRIKKGKAPDVYVCNQCGEKDCSCKKQVK